MSLLVLALTLVLAPMAQAAPPSPQQVKVVGATASSTLPKWKDYTFDAANLIDGRVDTSWQPAKMDTLGVGQWIELDLGEPHELSSVEIAQGLQKIDAKLGDLFCRNNRFADARLLFDDGTYAPYWADANVKVATVDLFVRGENLPANQVTKVVTRYIRLVVRSVLEVVDWKDLAIAEIRVFGRPSPATQADAKLLRWDRPGTWPLKTALLDYCAVNAETRKRRDCASLTIAVSEGHASFVPLAPVAVADVDKGEVELSFTSNRAMLRIGLKRGADGRWAVKAFTRLDEVGRPAKPTYENFAEPDDQHQNECWEKLGKERACDEGGVHVPDPDKVIEP